MAEYALLAAVFAATVIAVTTLGTTIRAKFGDHHRLVSAARISGPGRSSARSALRP